jgi:hypothetical protein
MNIRSIEDLAIRNERALEGHKWSIESLYESVSELNERLTELEKNQEKKKKVEKK